MPAKKRTRPGSNGLPAANTHALRELAGTPADPDVVLASLPIGTPDYLRVIGAYLKKYNHQHAKRHKGVGFKTMLERQRLYASFFTELRQHTAYRNLDPRQLANRHVEVVVRRWLERGLKTATLHNYLSFLRTFAGWIGKRGMVREPAYYVGSESPHAHRSEVATEDGSWTARNVEIKAKIAEIARFDSWSGMHLELELHFGLRGKEARHLRPHGAIIAREAANARDAAAFPECQTFLHIGAGAKGGRPRDVPIATDEQRELLARVLSAVAPGGFVGRPGFTTSQNQARFYSSMPTTTSRPTRAQRRRCAAARPALQAATSPGGVSPARSATTAVAPARRISVRMPVFQGRRPMHPRISPAMGTDDRAGNARLRALPFHPLLPTPDERTLPWMTQTFLSLPPRSAPRNCCSPPSSIKESRIGAC